MPLKCIDISKHVEWTTSIHCSIRRESGLYVKPVSFDRGRNKNKGKREEKKAASLEGRAIFDGQLCALGFLALRYRFDSQERYRSAERIYHLWSPLSPSCSAAVSLSNSCSNPVFIKRAPAQPNHKTLPSPCTLFFTHFSNVLFVRAAISRFALAWF